ncbi:MAG: DUF3380 domain-containing protein [Chloroflexi bacterium]|nr:DUF3380 domain-containing protein [Chloroflexota bacterium]
MFPQNGKTKTAVNLRSSPSSQSNRIDILKPFSKVTITSQENEYFHVTFGALTGFVHHHYVTVDTAVSTEETSAPASEGKSTGNINLRSGPGTDNDVTRLISKGSLLHIDAQVGEWLRVTFDGEMGYVHQKFVEMDIVAAMSSFDDLDAEPAAYPEDPVTSATGTTTAVLNFRAGPTTHDAILSVLPLGAKVEIHARRGDWFRGTANGQEGFVHSGFIMLDDEGSIGGFIETEEQGEEPSIADTPLEPADSEKIMITSSLSGTEKRLAKTWNKFGGLFAVLANRLGIDPGVAAAVFVAEAGGSGFRNGRMVIRFENHVFNRRWGKANPAKFAEHFRFQESRSWQGHEWRPSTSEAWRSFHGNQNSEYEVFTFAQSLSDTAAKLSISMGGPQIMGFNYSVVGYESVQGMYDAFSTSEADQIKGFFDFVNGPITDTRRLVALQRLDFETFASLYNGPGQAATYASIIGNLFEIYERLTQ